MCITDLHTCKVTGTDLEPPKRLERLTALADPASARPPVAMLANFMVARGRPSGLRIRSELTPELQSGSDLNAMQLIRDFRKTRKLRALA